MGQNHFWTGYCQRGHEQFSEFKSPPYRGSHLPHAHQARLRYAEPCQFRPAVVGAAILGRRAQRWPAMTGPEAKLPLGGFGGRVELPRAGVGQRLTDEMPTTTHPWVCLARRKWTNTTAGAWQGEARQGKARERGRPSAALFICCGCLEETKVHRRGLMVSPPTMTHSRLPILTVQERRIIYTVGDRRQSLSA